MLLTGWVVAATAARPPAPADIAEAREFCDQADLRPVEGLWSYPQDDVTVLIYRSDAAGVYDITVVDAADCSLSPGMRLGELRESSDPAKYTLQLYTKVKKGLLSVPVKALAEYSDAKQSMTVKKSTMKIRFNPTRLLPYFWRMVTVTMNTREGAPEGMIKVYPSYDGNGSSKREPRYL